MSADNTAEREPLAVLPDLKNLLPPLDLRERQQLEDNLVTAGRCTDPILTWRDPRSGRLTVVDGHNRLEIATRRCLRYSVDELQFGAVDDVKDFIVRRNLGRRNLSPEWRSYWLGKLYNESKAQGRRTDRSTSAQNDQKLAAERLADEAGVSAATVRRNGKFASDLDALVKAHGHRVREAILCPSGSIEAKHVQPLARLQPQEQERAVQRILDLKQLPSEVLRDLAPPRAPGGQARQRTIEMRPGINSVPIRRGATATLTLAGHDVWLRFLGEYVEVSIRCPEASKSCAANTLPTTTTTIKSKGESIMKKKKKNNNNPFKRAHQPGTIEHAMSLGHPDGGAATRARAAQAQLGALVEEIQEMIVDGQTGTAPQAAAERRCDGPPEADTPAVEDQDSSTEGSEDEEEGTSPA